MTENNNTGIAGSQERYRYWVPFGALTLLVSVAWATSPLFGVMNGHSLVYMGVIFLLAAVFLASLLFVDGYQRALILLALFACVLAFNFVAFSFRAQHDGRQLSIADSVPWQDALAGAAGMTAKMALIPGMAFLSEETQEKVDSAISILLPRPTNKPDMALLPIFEAGTLVSVMIPWAFLMSFYLMVVPSLFIAKIVQRVVLKMFPFAAGA